MPKFRVSISYEIKVYETYVVEFTKTPPDQPKHYVYTGAEAELLEEFHESPYDFCCPENRTDKQEGDIRDGSWREHVEEISPLDRIVEAISE